MLQAIAELGFVRNEAARQLRAGRSRTIGLVVLDVGNPFFTDLARGRRDRRPAEAGLSVVLCNSNDDVDRERHYLSLLQEQRAFGILITPVGTSNRRHRRAAPDGHAGRPRRPRLEPAAVLGVGQRPRRRRAGGART